MIFSLLQDFTDALAAMPAEHPRHRILKLLDEAIRRDVHFIDRHPTTLFQCLWNTCWWYDCPEAAQHYEPPEAVSTGKPPWEQPRPSISTQMESWRQFKTLVTPGFVWLRSLRPAAVLLDTGQ